MQTLGLSDSTPRTESRLKSLFWPTIESGADVDYLGAQGYWVCIAVGVFSLILSFLTGHPIAGAFILLFYFMSGVGVRERSRYAAIVVLAFFLVDALLPKPGVVSIIFGALLLSNLRAIWISSRWRPESEEASLPPRLGETWSDKFVDQLPLWLWPKVRFFYYPFSVCLFLLLGVGTVLLVLRGIR